MKKLFPVFIIGLFLGMVGCGGDSGTGNGGGGGTEEFEQANLLAYVTNTAPSMENVNDAIWDSAAVCSVRVGFDTLYGKNTSLNDDTLAMKVIVTSTDIYVKATWRDYTDDFLGSYIRKTSGAGAWELVNIADVGAGDDAFFIIFDVANGTEKADCATMCHAVANEMATTGGGNVDSWAWLSGTTNGAKLAEDQWIESSGGPDMDVLISGNKLAYIDNWDDGLSRPRFMHENDTSFHGDYLYTVDTTAFDGNPSFGWDSVSGYRMPAHIVDSTVYKTAGAGGAWDVKAISSYSGNHWTIVLKRALSTDKSSGAEQDDVELTGIDSIQVSIAVANHHTDINEDPGWWEHSGSYPFYLVFNRPATKP